MRCKPEKIVFKKIGIETGKVDRQGSMIRLGDILEQKLYGSNPVNYVRVETSPVWYEKETKRFRTVYDYEDNFKYTLIIGNVKDNPDLINP